MLLSLVLSCSRVEAQSVRLRDFADQCDGGTTQSVLVGAESFDSHGGWKLDTQFIEQMGSPYLLAHGLGRPVKDATKTITFAETGEYKVFVRTKDWVARWKAEGTPGRFELLVDGVAELWEPSGIGNPAGRSRLNRKA